MTLWKYSTTPVFKAASRLHGLNAVCYILERDLRVGMGATDTETEAREGSSLCDLLWWK